MQAILDRMEGTSAVLRLEDNQELIVSKTELPKGVKEGAALFLLLSEHTTEEEHREKLAKTLLNEILHPEK